jgi:hypothetical protein
MEPYLHSPIRLYERVKLLKTRTTVHFSGPGSSVGIATDYGLDSPGIESLVHKIAGSLPTEAVGFFLLEISTACSTIRYKRPLKVQYQNNEAQDTNKYFFKKSGGGEIFRTCPDRPWGPPSLLYNGYRVFPGGKAAGAWC